MSQIEERFRQAAEDVQRLPRRPDNETLLKLYALYKQATQGDASGRRPGFTDFVGRAKYDAWARLRGEDCQSAMEKYVALVGELQGKS